MPDKAKAFDLILRKAEFKAVVEIEGNRFNIGNKPKEFTDPTLTKEEYECIMKCANAEEDSLDKIIEEFKGLGWKHKKTVNDCLIVFTKPYNVLIINKYDSKHIFKKENFIEQKLVSLTLKELCLVNRILRLWGVEV